MLLRGSSLVQQHIMAPYVIALYVIAPYVRGHHQISDPFGFGFVQNFV